jgi:hypothetical protein
LGNASTGSYGGGGRGNGSFLPAPVSAQIGSRYITTDDAWGNLGYAIKSDGVM